jgi:hypothetical protein
MQIWAIREGLKRLNKRKHEWVERKCIRKAYDKVGQKCVRNHVINDGDVYFVRERFKLNDPPFCAGCMAMILYFLEVSKEPQVDFTHWDLKNGKPVGDEDG